MINREVRETLSLRFKVFFNNPLTPSQVWQVLSPNLSSDPWVYGVDGKWLRRQGVFIIHRNVTTKENLYWSFHPSESYTALSYDLEHLSELIGGNPPMGTISDWKGAIVSGVASQLGSIPHQRCLTHVVRQAKRLLPKRSPFPATLSLRHIAKQLIHIATEEERRGWLISLINWEKKYEHMLTQRTISDGTTQKKWWYTHGNLRRGWRLLTHNWSPFFVHLDHPLIPKSNNSLEGVISQASNKLGNHRGMKTSQQVSFLSWYFTFTRIKTKQDLKILWGYWKVVV